MADTSKTDTPMNDTPTTDTQIVKKKSGYDAWTMEESSTLLEIMVDAANRGWRDNSGVFAKQIVEQRILPDLNKKIKRKKNYGNYQSRLKWLKARWSSYSNLMKFSSGFGYDSISKKFTAPNEVWDEYLKAHPKDFNLRNGVIDDYEDLQIAIGGGVAVGKNSIGLGNVTEARTLEADHVIETPRIDELNYDLEGFEFEENDSSVMGSPEIFEASKKKLPTKRARSEYEGIANSSADTPKKDIFEQLTKLTTTFEGVYDLLQKRENERNYTAWDAIKEVPYLSEDVRLEAFNLLDTKTKKDGFLRMTPEERANWIVRMMSK